MESPEQTITVQYDGQPLSFTLTASATVNEFAPKSADKAIGFDNSVAARLRVSIGPWSEQDDLLLIVNDGYRSTPTTTILDWFDQWDDGILDRVEVLIATGTHAAPTEQHLKTIFGRHLDRLRDRIMWHDARDRDSMVVVGRDRFGEDVWLNRIAAERDCILAISSVEPHYFAGFTGGRKSFFPGLADLATIERNHNLANSLEAQPLRLAGNPVAEHLDELYSLLSDKELYGIQLVLDANGSIAEVDMGSLKGSFVSATETAGKIFGNRADEPYDIVIAEMLPPLDGNLYQLQKALENCQTAVADDGAIILVSACRDGIGSQHFYELSQTWDREANRPLDGVLRFGSHKLSRVISISRRCDIWVHSELAAKEVRQVFYEPLDKVSEFVFISLSKKLGSRVAVVRDAGNTVLMT